MSAIADFRLIETLKLNDLKAKAEIKIEKGLFSKKVIDHYWDYLNANSKKLKDFSGSGYIFADLLIFLEEKKGINLMKGQYDAIADEIVEKRQCSVFILTHDHKQKHLSDLAPGKFTLNELIEFNKEFSENEDPELAKAELEGIKSLKESLELIVDDGHVVIVSIG